MVSPPPARGGRQQRSIVCARWHRPSLSQPHAAAVGSFHKPHIREMAAEVGLRVAEKKDSQEICFVASGKHDEFVRERSTQSTAGQIVTTDGRIRR